MKEYMGLQVAFRVSVSKNSGALSRAIGYSGCESMYSLAFRVGVCKNLRISY